MQKFWKSVKIWQSYREFKGGNFFETQCIFLPVCNGIRSWFKAYAYSGFGAHKLTVIVHVLEPLEQIRPFPVLLCKELCKKLYTGPHLGAHSYKNLFEFYLKAAARCSKSCTQSFPLSFENFSKFLQTFAKIVAPTSNQVQMCPDCWKAHFVL